MQRNNKKQVNKQGKKDQTAQRKLAYANSYIYYYIIII